MKSTFIFVTFLILFVGVKADSFSNGLLTGIVVKNIDNRFSSKSKPIIRSSNPVTIDTGLISFPLNNKPICKEVDILEPIKKITKMEICLIIIIFAIMLTQLIYICLCGSDEDREWLFGYCIGWVLTEFLTDDRD